MRLIDFHRGVLDHARGCLAELDPASPTRSTIGWTATETIDHLIAVNAMCANATRQIGPDRLGADGVTLRQPDETPLAGWERTTRSLHAAFDADPLDALMPTPLGRPYPGSVVLTQNALEHLLHVCDLGPLLGAPPAIPDASVTEALARILERPDLWRQFRERGMYAEPVNLGPDASPLSRLLAYTGR
jgi:uncharacterized protein (TIGR03086 family)